MQSETKTCQNCKQQFVIEPEDFDFYEKMNLLAASCEEVHCEACYNSEVA